MVFLPSEGTSDRPRPWLGPSRCFLRSSNTLCFDCGCWLSFLEWEESSKHKEHEDCTEPDRWKSKIWKIYTDVRKANPTEVVKTEIIRYFWVFRWCACVSVSPVVSLHLLASRESDARAHLLHFRCGAQHQSIWSQPSLHRCWPPHKEDTSGSTSWNKSFDVLFRAGNTLYN